MRGLLFVILSFALTILCWGVYGPVLHWGQDGMSLVEGEYARWRPFVCVGLAYFVIGVVVPLIWLGVRGEKGHWTPGGIVWSLVAGTLGALGALGIILAFTFGGKPVYVMPLVFGGAPVINAFLTIYMARRLKEIGPMFLAGLVMVVLGAVVVLLFAPSAKPVSQAPASAASAPDETSPEPAPTTTLPGGSAMNLVVRLLSIALVIVCWGAYGPTLHRGQAAMDHSRMRPLVCVGLAYFVVAVVVPNLLLTGWPEQSHYGNFSGTFWSLAAGAAGAVGALGIIMAFNFGGKPVYVMPLVFGGAPVVNTLFTALTKGLLGDLRPMFLAGLILVIAGSAMVLVFAPRGAPPARVEKPRQPDAKKAKKIEETNPLEAAPGDA